MVKLWPRTAASWSSVRSATGSESSRAATSARRDGGIARRSAAARSATASPARTIRTSSMPYSGIPSARATTASTRSSLNSGARPASSSRISAGSSGSRWRVTALRPAAPRVGRRSRSSGRARAMTRIGWFRDHSRSESMKSSSPSSAHWRSSNTRADRAARGDPPRRIAARPRTARSRSPPTPARRPAGPAGAARSSAGPRRRDIRLERGRRAWPLTTAGASVSSSPARLADHLAERPVGDPLAVRRRSAAVPVDRLDQAVEILLELPGEPALADARLAGDGDERARRSSPVAASGSLSSRSSASRPTNGASSRSAPAADRGGRRPRASPATPRPARPCP